MAGLRLIRLPHTRDYLAVRFILLNSCPALFTILTTAYRTALFITLTGDYIYYYSVKAECCFESRIRNVSSRDHHTT